MKNDIKRRRSIAALLAFVFSVALCVLGPTSQAQAAPLDPGDSDPATVLTVTQHFTQPAGVGASGVFSYELTALDGSDGKGDLPAGAGDAGEPYRFTMDGEATANPFASITFSHSGVFTYDLHQVDAGEVGYTYDATDYTVTVEVGPQEDGSYTIIAATAQAAGADGKAAALVFSALFAIDGTDSTLMTNPPVNKTVQGAPASDETWEFDLTAQDPANPMPEGSDDGSKAVFITGSGTAEFGQWSYTAVGTYRYQVTEKNTGAAGYAYDESVYTITDYVTPGEGRLVLDRVVTNSSNKNVDSYDFVNVFAPPVSGATDVPISGATDLPISGATDVGGPLGALVATGGLILGPVGTDAVPFIALLSAAILGMGGCLFFLLVWKRRKDDDEDAAVSVRA